MRYAVMVAAALVLGACDSSTAPDAGTSSLAGTYDLVGAMGGDLPATLSTMTTHRNDLLSAVLHLHPSGRWADTTLYDRHHIEEQRPDIRSVIIEGTWAASDAGMPTVWLYPEGNDLYKTAVCAIVGRRIECDVHPGFATDALPVYERR